MRDFTSQIFNNLIVLSSQNKRAYVIKQMTVLQAASQLAFAPGPHTVLSLWDGVRLGSPAQELLLHVMWNSKTGVSATLPPAVPPYVKSKQIDPWAGHCLEDSWALAHALLGPWAWEHLCLGAWARGPLGLGQLGS